MSVAWKQGDSSVSESRLRNGDKVTPIWVPKGGKVFANKPADYHSMHRLCDVVEISDITPEFLNERDLFNVGKERSTVNDGVKWTGTLTGSGNALEIKGALLGKDFHKYPVVKEGSTVTAAGHLFLLAATPDTLKYWFSTVMLDCEIKFTDIPGATDGTSDFTIEFAVRTDIYSTAAQLFPIRELWYAGTSPADGTTTITNANAPDGTNTTFKLGSGNNTGLTDTPLAVAVMEDSAGTAAEYILEYRTNESITTGFTYASSTGIITPSSTLTAGTKLEVVYFVRGGARSWSSTVAYGKNEIVSYSDKYFKSDTASTGTAPVPGTPASPWPLYEGFGVVSGGGSGVGTPLIPYNQGNEFDMFQGWNDLYRV